jgi:hypothetical protein
VWIDGVDDNIHFSHIVSSMVGGHDSSLPETLLFGRGKGRVRKMVCWGRLSSKTV